MKPKGFGTVVWLLGYKSGNKSSVLNVLYEIINGGYIHEKDFFYSATKYYGSKPTV